MNVAGHTMENRPYGRVCVAVSDATGNMCGRRWCDIRNSTVADVNKPHIAHIGNLTATELEQIITERVREDAVIAEATRVAAGFGMGGMLPGSEVNAELVDAVS